MSALDDLLASTPKATKAKKVKATGSALDRLLGPSAPAGEKPSAGEKGVTTKVKRIEASKDKSAIAKAKDVANKNVVSPLMKILEAADLPRAAVVSGIHEIADTAGGGKNTHNLLTGIKGHEGVGDWLETTDLPINVKRALGLIGDVALDPLMYVAPEEGVLNLGKKGVAKALLEVGAKDLTEKGAREAVAKAARGASNLSTEELASIGAKGGVYFNVPGTGRFGQAAGLSKKTKQVQLLKHGGAPTAVARGLQAATGKARDSKAVSFFGDAVGGSSGPLRKLFRSGDPEKSEVGLRALDETAKGRGQGRRFESEWGEKLRPILRDVRKSKSGKEVLEGARGGAVKAGTEDQVTALHAWFADVRAAANTKADEDFIKEVEDYVFRRRTDALSEKLGGKGRKTTAFRASGPETKREYVAGETFFGVDLLPPRQAGRSIEAQMEEIAKAQFGPEYVGLFDNNIDTVTTAYLKVISKRVGEKLTENGLNRHGIIIKDGAHIIDPAVQAARDVADQVGVALTHQRTLLDDATKRVATATAVRDAATAGPPDPLHAVFVAEADKAKATADKIAADVADLEWRQKLHAGSRDATTQQDIRRFDAAQAELEDVTQRLELATNELRKVEVAGGVDEVSARRADALRAEIADLEGQATDLGSVPEVADDVEQAARPAAEVKADLDKVTELSLELKRLRRDGHSIDAHGLPVEEQLEALRPRANELRDEYKAALEAGDPHLALHGGIDSIDDRIAALRSIEWDGKKGQLDTRIRDEGFFIMAPDIAKSTWSGHLVEPFIVDNAPPEVVAFMRDSFDTWFRPTETFHELADAAKQWATDPAVLAAAEELDPGLGGYVSRWGEAIDDVQRVYPEWEAAPVTPARNAKTLRSYVDDLDGSVDQARAARDDAALTYYENELQLAAFDMSFVDAIADGKSVKNQWRKYEQDLRLGAKDMLDDADRLAKDAANADLAMAVRLQAQAKVVEANLTANRKAALDAVSFTEAEAAKLHQLFADGFKAWGIDTGMQAPDYLVDILQRTSKVTTAEGLQTFLHAWDRFHATWKAYAIGTPGFHFRNTFGGVFNNFLHGLDHGAYRKFIAADLGKATGKEADYYKLLLDHGQIEGGQTAAEVARSVSTSKLGSANPLRPDFAPLKGSRAVGVKVENLLRGALGMDVLRNGGSIDDAIEAIAKYHFDYEDLSDFERNVARRVIPFYTWTRKNLPLQIESFMRQPQKYVRYLAVARNTELGVDKDEVVPSYFGEGLGVQTPFHIGDASVHVMPDLPFASLADQAKYVTNPARALENASPLIKMPLELNAKKQFFADLPISDRATPMPGSWSAIPGFAAALGAAGLAKKDKNNQWLMSQRDAYKLEQLMPIFGRSRRLLPTEEKYTQRLVTSLLSFGFGIGAVSNSEQTKNAEIARRNRELTKIINDLKDRKIIETKA